MTQPQAVAEAQARSEAAFEALFRGARKAATPVVTTQGFAIGIARENVPGYVPAPIYHTWEFRTYDEAKAEADTINAEVFNLSKEDAWAWETHGPQQEHSQNGLLRS